MTINKGIILKKKLLLSLSLLLLLLLLLLLMDFRNYENSSFQKRFSPIKVRKNPPHLHEGGVSLTWAENKISSIKERS